MRKYTKEEKIENKKKNKIIGTISSVIVGMFLCVTAYFIWNLLKLSNIETALRYIGIAILVITSILIVRLNFSLRVQPKKYKFIILILVLIAFGVGEYFASSIISKAISTLDNMNKNTTVYTSKLIALKDGGTTKKNITKDDKKIGIISDEEDIEGYVLAQKIIKEQGISTDNIYDYDEDITMLKALYDGEIDACFVVGNYISRYKNNISFEHIADETKVLFTYSKEMETQKSTIKEKKKTSVTEPFSILFLGVDSNDDEIDDWGLGDTIILVTFNPKTLNATIFSIPRDTFVQISCAGNRYSKITHANPYGSDCVVETVENFTGIHIDYYAKMNFKGVISLVDALGGIDVNVPYAICESDQNRSFDTEVITIDEGYQHLNGKQALALARNRKVYDWCGEYYSHGERNDFVRGQNQQLVIKGIMNSVKNIRTADQFYQVLDAVGKTLETNLSREQMLEFYNVFKDVILSTDSLTDTNDIISMQRTYLNGSDGHLHDYLVGAPVYEFLPSMNSLNAITQAMRINLGLEEEDYATSFSFSIDHPYEAAIIGKNEWGGIKNYPQPDPEPAAKTCGENEELGADGQTCLCKSGYTKKDGKCVKETESEISCTNATVVEGKCVCWAGYEKDSNGDCVKSSGSESSGSESGGSESGGSESGGSESGGSESGSGESGDSESGDSGDSSEGE